MIELDIIKRIHASVFNNFVYVTDNEQYGVKEEWVAPTDAWNEGDKLVGDCEDFALACRVLCRRNGIDYSRLVVCEDETQSPHVILEVTLSDLRSYILDNRMKRVVTMEKLEKIGYTWLALSGYEDGSDWTKLYL